MNVRSHIATLVLSLIVVALSVWGVVVHNQVVKMESIAMEEVARHELTQHKMHLYECENSLHLARFSAAGNAMKLDDGNNDSNTGAALLEIETKFRSYFAEYSELIKKHNLDDPESRASLMVQMRDFQEDCESLEKRAFRDFF